MIQVLRVDDNLLHGQVAFSWVRNLQIHTIVIADDKVINDEFVKMTLGLSKPPGVTLKILSVNDAVAFIKENQQSKLNVMAIVNSINNAYIIQKEIQSIRSINVGLLRTSDEVVFHYNSTYMNETDIKQCKELINAGVQIELRLRYNDEFVLLKDLLNE